MIFSTVPDSRIPLAYFKVSVTRVLHAYDLLLMIPQSELAYSFVAFVCILSKA